MTLAVGFVYRDNFNDLFSLLACISDPSDTYINIFWCIFVFKIQINP